MSHLTEFSRVLAYVERLLGGEAPPIEGICQHGQFGVVRVWFPLIGIPPLKQVGEFYSDLNTEVERSQLKRERKTVYRKFISAAYLAHHAAEEHQPHWGSIYHLQSCLSYITLALRLMERSKEYDDGQPVHWSEVYREGSPQSHPPGEYWLLFKLESLLPVLRLSVRILRLVLPHCSHTWEEWEASLCRKEWLEQFILDSRMSSCRSIPRHAPRRIDVVGLSSLEVL
ncbi:hypothetical protein ANO14919_108460 [Xylariales sp. No.14919]|nr:hypothetical protein F5X98DRAFT_3537 [Xylaria grammica]GAW21327.1 hypothetical protein ANO14919_108460 [Xylariales sp. No.14919]